MKRSVEGVWSKPFILSALSKERDSIERCQTEVEVFRLCSKKPPPISNYLRANKEEILPGTILDFLERRYREAGWSSSEAEIERKEKPLLEPVLDLPSYEYHYFYTVLGISTEKIEPFFHSIDPSFDLSLFLLGLCQEAGKKMSNCFPSLANEISNSEKRREYQENKKRRTHSEQRPKRSRESKYFRILPLSSLALVLSRLPDFYLELNVVATQCELLEKTVWVSLDLPEYDDYVKTQLSLMKHNRHFIHYRNQTLRDSQFDSSLYKYEMDLKKAESIQKELIDWEYFISEKKNDQLIEKEFKKIQRKTEDAKNNGSKW